MSAQKGVVAIGSALAAFLLVSLACDAAGVSSAGFVVLPLAAATGAAWFVIKKSGVQ